MQSRYSTKWMYNNKKWYNPFEWQVQCMHYWVYAHESDYYEIEEILQEKSETINQALAAGEDIWPMLDPYIEFESKVRQYMHEQLKRYEKGQ